MTRQYVILLGFPYTFECLRSRFTYGDDASRPILYLETVVVTRSAKHFFECLDDRSTKFYIVNHPLKFRHGTTRNCLHGFSKNFHDILGG